MSASVKTIIRHFDVVQFILLNYKQMSLKQVSEELGITQFQAQSLYLALNIGTGGIEEDMQVKRGRHPNVNMDKIKTYMPGLVGKVREATEAKPQKRVIMLPADSVPNRQPIQRAPAEYTNIPSPYGLATQMLMEQNREELEKRKTG